MPLTQNSIEHVVEDQLCHRCGACLPICPVADCITLGPEGYPRVNAQTCVECGVCERVCSGDKLDLEGLRERGGSGAVRQFGSFGGFGQPMLVKAANPATRLAGASGGFVTQLLVRLLETGRIDGAVVAGMDEDRPWEALPVIARNPQQVRAATGSKYTVVPMVSVLRQVIRQGRNAPQQRIAFVGVSCHIHSLRMMMDAFPQVKRRIVLTVGLLCKSAFDSDALTDLLKVNALDLKAITKVEYRGGNWPGVMRATLKSGQNVPLHYSNYKDGVYNYLMSLYTQPRCHLCFDYTNELADLSVGDPYARDEQGRYQHADGRTLVLPRTALGLETLQWVCRDAGFLTEAVDEQYVQKSFGRVARQKNELVQVRIEKLGQASRPLPRYDRKLPAVDRRARLSYLLFRLTLLPGRFPRLRRALLWLLVSRLGLPLVWLGQWRKYGLRATWYVNRLTPRSAGREQSADFPARPSTQSR